MALNTVKLVIKLIYRFFCRIVLFGIITYSLTVANDSQIKFIVFGHTTDLIQLNNIDNFIFDINAENPDYVFILGDADLWREDFFNKWESKINAPTFYAPGNHDLFRERKDKYHSLVGYNDTLIVSDGLNFILINSSRDVNDLIKYFEKTFKQLKNNLNPTILFTHHRIWDDNIIGDFPYQHDKSFLYSEIQPLIKNKIDYIFAGNSPRQYFQGTYFLENYQQNPNIVYWCDYVDNIWCYSIGMGHGSFATYALVTFDEFGFRVKPKYSIKFDSNDQINNSDYGLINSEDKGYNLKKIFSIILMIITTETFLLGVVSGTFVAYIFYKRKYKK